MGFLFSIAVLITGYIYIRKLENRIDDQNDKIYTLEQIINMNLMKDEKEKTSQKEVKEAKQTS